MEIGARKCRGWVSGSTDDGYYFNAKVFDLPSIFGLPTERVPEGGNVSKLYIRDAEGREVYAYDRGYNHGETVPHYADAAAGITAELEARFCKEAV